MSSPDDGLSALLATGISAELATKLCDVKVISFDLDDTLWPLDATIANAEDLLYRWMEGNTPDVTAKNSSADIFALRRDFADTHPHLKADVTALRKGALAELFAQYDYPLTLVDDAFQTFYRARSAVVPYDGVAELLTTLRRHYKIAALTNGNADLEIAGMAHFFDNVQHATLDNPPKPDITMFVRAAAALQCDPSQILHIGDNVETDVGGGNNAGALTVWFNQNEETGVRGSSQADIELHSLSQLLQYLPLTLTSDR